MTRTKSIYLALVVLLSPIAANADVIHEQGDSNNIGGQAYAYVGQELANDFIALATGTITNATWAGFYYGATNTSGTESFTFNLFAGGGSLPGALIASVIGIANIVASATPTYFDYSMNFGGPTVTAGTAYWVSIYSNDSPTDYAWVNSNDGSADGAVRGNGGAWRDLAGSRANHVFALNTTSVDVPEPGTLALLGLGLVGMAARRKKKI